MISVESFGWLNRKSVAVCIPTPGGGLLSPSLSLCVHLNYGIHLKALTFFKACNRNVSAEIRVMSITVIFKSSR